MTATATATLSAADIDALFRRLAARGSFRIVPCNWAADDVALHWWPPGQEGNPFCQRTFLGSGLSEVLYRAVTGTRPREHSLETLVDHYLYTQREKSDA